ncbi:MAG: HD domain-containing protein [Planctomycetaceae bacterium]|nr:HD domain-containing protein [Planctomycetaceae bacterium]
MASDKLRREIVFESARLMYSRQESEYYRAKMKAARKLCRGWVKPSDLPSNAEIRQEIQRFAALHEGDSRLENLLNMRLDALRIMRLLERFRPYLIGSTLTGHVRHGSDIDIHVFTSSVDAVVMTLQDEGHDCDVERKRVRKYGEERVFTHIHVRDRFPVEITCYAADLASYPFKSSITGKTIERASIHELEMFIAQEHPEIALEEALSRSADAVDRFQVYRSLLLPLEDVEQSRKYHPEGDALYHSLQVFELARDMQPYDEEFLLAALLHDVGKAIDPDDHVEAGLEALDGYITDRTAWLIEHHMEAHRIHDGSIGYRARRRLAESEDYPDLLLLGECDRDGRVPGMIVSDLDEVLDDLREISRLCG